MKVNELVTESGIMLVCIPEMGELPATAMTQTRDLSFQQIAMANFCLINASRNPLIHEYVITKNRAWGYEHVLKLFKQHWSEKAYFREDGDLTAFSRIIIDDADELVMLKLRHG